jgi:hypothetical protein
MVYDIDIRRPACQPACVLFVRLVVIMSKSYLIGPAEMKHTLSEQKRIRFYIISLVSI